MPCADAGCLRCLCDRETESDFVLAGRERDDACDARSDPAQLGRAAPGARIPGQVDGVSDAWQQPWPRRPASEFREIKAAGMHAPTAADNATGNDAHKHLRLTSGHALRASFRDRLPGLRRSAAAQSQGIDMLYVSDRLPRPGAVEPTHLELRKPREDRSFKPQDDMISLDGFDASWDARRSDAIDDLNSVTRRGEPHRMQPCTAHAAYIGHREARVECHARRTASPESLWRPSRSCLPTRLTAT